jgi:hypothetical protein
MTDLGRAAIAAGVGYVAFQQARILTRIGGYAPDGDALYFANFWHSVAILATIGAVVASGFFLIRYLRTR